jgi:AraC-like DNA-binding protein
MSELHSLRVAVLALATRPGVNALPLSGAWIYRADEPGAMTKQASRTLTVGVVVQGKKRVHIDGTELVYDERHCIVFTGEGPYASQVLEASPERPYLSLGIAVPPDLVARTLVDLADVTRPRPHASGALSSAFLARLDDAVLEPLGRLVATLHDPAERRVIAPLCVAELVFRLLRSDAASVLRAAACRGGDEARIAEVMEFIRAHLHRKLTVEQLAKRAGMSASHFAHRFREVARVSPIRYLKHARLDHARALLLRDGSRAGDVAARTGYASAAHFARDFKQQFGHTPRQYVERMRGAAGSGTGSGKGSAAPGMAEHPRPA